MKIDLHCHTMKTKSGDPETRNVDVETFYNAIMAANIKICAITNHNHFNKQQYLDFVEKAKNDFLIFPGIELDVKGFYRNGHVILVVNPKQIDLFDKYIKDLLNGKHPDDVLLDYMELVTIANQFDCLVLAHFNKAKSLDEETIDKIKENLIDNFRFFYEPSNYRSLGIYNNHAYYSLMGSDVKDWQQYDNCKFSELKLDVDSFEQLMLLIKKDPRIVKTLLSNKTAKEIDISYKPIRGKKKNKTNVLIYDDINIVFGGKGTGKSETLKQISQYYKGNSIPYTYYSPSTTEDEIKSKLDINQGERRLEKLSANNQEVCFNRLKEWKETDIVPLKSFIDYIKTGTASAEKNKLIISNTPSFLEVDDTFYLNKYDDCDTYLDWHEFVSNLDIDKYLEKDEVKAFYSIIEKLRKGIVNDTIEEWVDLYSKMFVNNSLVNIRRALEEKTESKTKPNKTGLFEFINNRCKLYADVYTINSGFNVVFPSETEFVGELGIDKDLYKVTQYRMLSRASRTEEFEKKINSLRAIQKQLKALEEDIFTSNLNDSLAELLTAIENNSIESLDDFLGVKKVFTLDVSDLSKIKPYTPSTGEATMIVLHEKLNAENNVFILDEPEKSLGNAYVNDVIVPKLINLAKSRKTVIVATHNANIAVRTLPYTSILKTYDNGEYRTYVGNPFSNTLLEINGKHELNWKSESVKILEGGREAFDERGEIYDG